MSEDKKEIIIAEDDKQIRELYATAFLMEGFHVVEAGNGKEVLNYLKDNRGKIKAILLDIVLPKVDGFEVLEKMGKDEEYKKIPVYVITNLENDNDKRTALGLGAKEYFKKVDWTPKRLAEKIKGLCGE
ncbi:MAG: Response regulator receiver protein [Candidatus Moranbacteria bacterium GW2011_GWE2_47_10]|nr:MAG: Response regulator receiver protein [Candidatus Moranbacteria bacterium GW2011_GWE2_47_10]HBP01173.1 response regulator [Candidatus Moranbacteria bacterium]